MSVDVWRQVTVPAEEVGEQIQTSSRVATRVGLTRLHHDLTPVTLPSSRTGAVETVDPVDAGASMQAGHAGTVVDVHLKKSMARG